LRRALEEWRARPTVSGLTLASSDNMAELSPGSPEAFAAEYLTMLSMKNYGGLAKATVDYPKRTISYRAGRLREELKGITIESWAIIGVEDTGPTTSVVMAKLKGQVNGRAWCCNQCLNLFFADENYDPVGRGQPEGAWSVMPDFLGHLWRLGVGNGDGPKELRD
jgi:hypothetical protein